ncbi:MAG: DUF177 domain-containing protein [Dehalococcoidia bacterium]|nr:DUF177 domain-containing protein [Dehalococcoidia bacterium]
MQINVAQFLKSPQGTSRVVAIDDMYDDGTGPVPVRGELTFTSIDQRILVQGRLTIELQFVCGRCLKPFPCKLNMDIEEEYQPTVDINTGTHIPPPDESGAFTIDEHHVLDLTEAIRQYKETTIPMKPLCREDCAGICPTCGKDLNEGQCGCPAEVIDPRWAELLKLKNKGRK